MSAGGQLPFARGWQINEWNAAVRHFLASRDGSTGRGRAMANGMIAPTSGRAYATGYVPAVRTSIRSPCIFTAAGLSGECLRNMLRGPDSSFDVSAVKHHSWHVAGKSGAGRFRVSVQRLNRANFGFPIGWCSPATMVVEAAAVHAAGQTRAPPMRRVRCNLAKNRSESVAEDRQDDVRILQAIENICLPSGVTSACSCRSVRQPGELAFLVGGQVEQPEPRANRNGLSDYRPFREARRPPPGHVLISVGKLFTQFPSGCTARSGAVPLWRPDTQSHRRSATIPDRRPDRSPGETVYRHRPGS